MFRSLAVVSSRMQAPASSSMLRPRFFSRSSRALEKSLETKEPSTPTASSSPSAPAPEPSRPVAPPRALTTFDKKMLVWVGKYKSVEEVPGNVAHETLDRARNRFRVKVLNYMMVATVIGCIIMIISGKRAAQRGESVTKWNLDWHREYNEAAAAKEKAEAEAAKKK